MRGLAAKLAVSKPAITRALDRLSEFDLVRRKTDPLDRRSGPGAGISPAWRSCARTEDHPARRGGDMRMASNRLGWPPAHRQRGTRGGALRSGNG